MACNLQGESICCSDLHGHTEVGNSEAPACLRPAFEDTRLGTSSASFIITCVHHSSVNHMLKDLCHSCTQQLCMTQSIHLCSLSHCKPYARPGFGLAAHRGAGALA